MASAQNNEDLITVKDIVLTVKAYAAEIRRRWKVILILFILLGGYKLYHALTTDPVYQAKLTFMLNEEQGGIGGGLSSILGDFGFGNGEEYNYKKLIELSRSRKIFSQVVFDTVEIDGQPTLLANALIDEFSEYGEWGKSRLYAPLKINKLKGFHFQGTDLSSFNRLQRAAWLLLYEMVQKILSVHVDEDTGILTILVNTHSEDLSQALANRYFDKLSEYYVAKTTEKQAYTFHLLQDKVDSLQELITKKEYQIASHQDASRGVWSHKAKVPLSKLKKEVHLLYIMLGEAVKNKEISDFALNDKTPFIQAIDKPVSPLLVFFPVWWIDLALALIVSFLLGSLYIAITKWYRDAMNT